MKRRDLERRLRITGCYLKRDGSTPHQDPGAGPEQPRSGMSVIPVSKKGGSDAHRVLSRSKTGIVPVKDPEEFFLGVFHFGPGGKNPTLINRRGHRR